MRRKEKRILKRFFYLLPFLLFIIALFFIGNIFIKNSYSSIFKPKNDTKIIQPYLVENYAKDIKKKLEIDGLEVKSLDTSNDGLKINIVLRNGTLVVFSNDKNIEWQIKSLRLIFSELSTDKGIPKKVDFSFDKTIVNY